MENIAAKSFGLLKPVSIVFIALSFPTTLFFAYLFFSKIPIIFVGPQEFLNFAFQMTGFFVLAIGLARIAKFVVDYFSILFVEIYVESRIDRRNPLSRDDVRRRSHNIIVGRIKKVSILGYVVFVLVFILVLSQVVKLQFHYFFVFPLLLAGYSDFYARSGRRVATVWSTSVISETRDAFIAAAFLIFGIFIAEGRVEKIRGSGAFRVETKTESICIRIFFNSSQFMVGMSTGDAAVMIPLSEISSVSEEKECVAKPQADIS